jgi:hypothetical protein
LRNDWPVSVLVGLILFGCAGADRPGDQVVVETPTEGRLASVPLESDPQVIPAVLGHHPIISDLEPMTMRLRVEDVGNAEWAVVSDAVADEDGDSDNPVVVPPVPPVLTDDPKSPPSETPVVPPSEKPVVPLPTPKAEPIPLVVEPVSPPPTAPMTLDTAQQVTAHAVEQMNSQERQVDTLNEDLWVIINKLRVEKGLPPLPPDSPPPPPPSVPTADAPLP